MTFTKLNAHLPMPKGNPAKAGAIAAAQDDHAALGCERCQKAIEARIADRRARTQATLEFHKAKKAAKRLASEQASRDRYRQAADDLRQAANLLSQLAAATRGTGYQHDGDSAKAAWDAEQLLAGLMSYAPCGGRRQARHLRKGETNTCLTCGMRMPELQ